MIANKNQCATMYHLHGTGRLDVQNAETGSPVRPYWRKFTFILLVEKILYRIKLIKNILKEKVKPHFLPSHGRDALASRQSFTNFDRAHSKQDRTASTPTRPATDQTKPTRPTHALA